MINVEDHAAHWRVENAIMFTRYELIGPSFKGQVFVTFFFLLKPGLGGGGRGRVSRVTGVVDDYVAITAVTATAKATTRASNLLKPARP